MSFWVVALRVLGFHHRFMDWVRSQEGFEGLVVEDLRLWVCWVVCQHVEVDGYF